VKHSSRPCEKFKFEKRENLVLPRGFVVSQGLTLFVMQGQKGGASKAVELARRSASADCVLKDGRSWSIWGLQAFRKSCSRRNEKIIRHGRAVRWWVFFQSFLGGLAVAYAKQSLKAPEGVEQVGSRSRNGLVPNQGLRSESKREARPERERSAEQEKGSTKERYVST